MLELNDITKKRLMWLLAQAKQNGGVLTIDRRYPAPPITVMITDIARSFYSEMTVSRQTPGENPIDGWAFRLVFLKNSIDNTLPIYPAMYCDDDFGLHHLCSWENDVDHVERLRGKPLTRANGVKPLILEMHDPYINLAIPVIERHVDAMWRTHNLPTLKRHEQLATV